MIKGCKLYFIPRLLSKTKLHFCAKTDCGNDIPSEVLHAGLLCVMLLVWISIWMWQCGTYQTFAVISSAAAMWVWLNVLSMCACYLAQGGLVSSLVQEQHGQAELCRAVQGASTYDHAWVLRFVKSISVLVLYDVCAQVWECVLLHGFTRRQPEGFNMKLSDRMK